MSFVANKLQSKTLQTMIQSMLLKTSWLPGVNALQQMPESIWISLHICKTGMHIIHSLIKVELRVMYSHALTTMSSYGEQILSLYMYVCVGQLFLGVSVLIRQNRATSFNFFYSALILLHTSSHPHLFLLDFCLSESLSVSCLWNLCLVIQHLKLEDEFILISLQFHKTPALPRKEVLSC